MILLGLLTAGVVIFATGLGLRGTDFRRLAEMLGPGLFGLTLQVIGLPIAAMLIGRALAVAPYDGMGLMLAALAPASLASQTLVGLAGGHVGLSRTLVAWSTLFWVPIILLLGLAAAMPAMLTVALIGVVLPFPLGLLIARRAPVRAARWQRRLMLAGSLLTLLLAILTLMRNWTFITAGLVLAVLLLAFLAMLAGLLGRAFGRGLGLTLGISTPVQNIALPLAVGTIGDFGQPAVLYAVAMYLMALVVLILSRRIA